MFTKIFNFRNFATTIGLTSGGVTLFEFAKKANESKIKEELDMFKTENANLREIIKKNEIASEETKVSIIQNSTKADSEIELAKKEILHAEELKKKTPELSAESTQLNVGNHLNRAQEYLDKTIKEASNLYGKTNKFLEDFNFYKFIENYRNYISSLDLNQLCQLITISFSIPTLICFINILIINFGDYIINYLELDKRYPKLARIIDIRKKFSKFYIFINSIIMFISILTIIFINIITFLM
jgi:hypothetical protein